MSGHSKWSQIKHKKALTDAKKGKTFSKLARMITIAVKEKGANPETNSSLRMTIDKAKSLNMPQDNIDRAIKRGTGEIEGAKMEEFLCEAYGPGGIALLVQGITDNKNRTLAEIKNILTRHNGKFAQRGSVAYLFNKKGVIIVETDKDQEATEMQAIDSGAEDLRWQDALLEIQTKPEKIEEVKANLEQKAIKIINASYGWVAQNKININNAKIKQQTEALLEALEEQDEVNEIYTNHIK